jgi:hypothetical protein
VATTFIYALCEPGTRTVRYIGKTENLGRRFREHLRGSSKKKSHLGNWLRSLAGDSPNRITLCEVPESEGSAAEIQYIRAARESLGMKLVNATDGGEGVSNPSPESRVKMSAAKRGKKASPETRAKMSVAQRGRTRAPLSKEHCANISAAKTGVPWPPGQRAKQSATKTGVPWSPARRAAHEAKKNAKL